MGEGTKAEQPEVQAQTLAMRSLLLPAGAPKRPGQRGAILGTEDPLGEHRIPAPDFRTAKLSSCEIKGWFHLTRIDLGLLCSKLCAGRRTRGQAGEELDLVPAVH